MKTEWLILALKCWFHALNSIENAQANINRLVKAALCQKGQGCNYNISPLENGTNIDHNVKLIINVTQWSCKAECVKQLQTVQM